MAEAVEELFSGVRDATLIRQTIETRKKDWDCHHPRCHYCVADLKVVRHGRYATFQLAEVAIPRTVFADILRRIDRLRPALPSGGAFSSHPGRRHVAD